MNKTDFGVTRIEQDDFYPFYLICMDLSHLNVSKEKFEFIDLDPTKELRIELQFSQKLLDEVVNFDTTELMTFDYLYHNGGFGSINFY